jgi:zinc protease
MKLRNIFGIVSLLLLSLLANAQKYNLNDPIPFDPEFKIGVLPNGIRYMIRANKQPVGRANFYIIYSVGSIQEEANQSGLAHFIEHLAFGSNPQCPKTRWIDYFKLQGLKMGQDINASTGIERTIYKLCNVPTGKQGVVDSVMVFLQNISNCFVFDSLQIERERKVIREEWRSGEDFQSRIDRQLRPIIFKDSKYATCETIGDTAVMNHLKISDLISYYQIWYRPDHATILAIGDFDTATLVSKIRQTFSNVSPSEGRSPKISYLVPDNNQPLVGIVYDAEATSTNINISYKQSSPKIYTLEYLRNKFIERLIEDMVKLRLYELSNGNNPPFQSAGSSFSIYYNGSPSMNSFAFTAKAINNDAMKGLSAILAESERIGRYGFTATELERAKSTITRGQESGLVDHNNWPNSELYYPAYHFLVKGEPSAGFDFNYNFQKEILPQITIADVNERFNSYVHDKNMVVTISGPKKEGVKIPSEQEIRDAIVAIKKTKLSAYHDMDVDKKLFDRNPKPGTIREAKENPDMATTEWVLANGMRVVLKTTHFVVDEIKYEGSSIGGLSQVDDKDYISASYLSKVVSTMGLGTISNTDMVKILNGKTAAASVYLTDNYDIVSGSCSPKDFETCLQLINLRFTKPRWDEDAFATFMEKEEARYLNVQTNAGTAFNDSIRYLLSNRHYRARPINSEVLKEVSFKKIKTIYLDRFRDPGNFTFLFVGNISPADAKPMVEKYLASLPAAKRKEVYKDNNVRPPTGKVCIDFEKESITPRTSVYINYTNSSPYTLHDLVYNDLLTQVLQDECTATLRGKKAGVYGVNVSKSVKRLPESTFSVTIAFSTDPAKADELRKLAHAEVARLIEQGPSQTKLNRCVQNLLNDRPNQLKSNFFWLNIALTEYYLNNVDVVKDYESILKSATPTLLKEHAQKVWAGSNVVEVIMRSKAPQ